MLSMRSRLRLRSGCFCVSFTTADRLRQASWPTASGLTRGAVSKIVDKLDAKGWVQTDAKEGDSRFRLLSLTRAGRRSLPVLAEIADQNDARYFDCLSAREKSVLRELLIKLADHNRINDVPTE